MTIYDIPVETIDGKQATLAPHRGKAMLIVNVASRCGFTPQYDGLEKLYRKYRDRGLVVLGFPCNQFGGQEPGTNEEIQSFCQTKYDVTFPLYAKVDVNGAGAHPLFQFLKKEQKGILGTEAVKWNFTKFLVAPSGEVVERFSPQDAPDALDKKIALQLPE